MLFLFVMPVRRATEAIFDTFELWSSAPCMVKSFHCSFYIGQRGFSNCNPFQYLLFSISDTSFTLFATRNSVTCRNSSDYIFVPYQFVCLVGLNTNTSPPNFAFETTISRHIPWRKRDQRLKSIQVYFLRFSSTSYHLPYHLEVPHTF